jgi:hypothetical protein
MAGRGKREQRRGAGKPIPAAPVDLLAGLAPDVELTAHDLPPGIASDPELPSPGSTPASACVAEGGKLIRAGDRTVRRLIRTRVLHPAGAAAPDADADTDRAGVVPRTPDKPGE